MPDTSITTKDIIAFQTGWAKGIEDIGASFKAGGDYASMAENFISAHYAYEEGPVLFKPTKARAVPFRGRKSEALSYFIGGEIAEDTGFAINPWAKVEFHQPHFALPFLVMGQYTMHPYEGEGDPVLAEYSMGFVASKAGELKLNLHHSSLPYPG